MVDATTIIDYDFYDFSSGVDYIARSIRSSGWVPDYIVGIVRGGSVPAVYLSHKLKVPVVMVAWNTRDTTIFGKESNCWIPEDIHRGKKVLVVDDIIDGGDTIRELLADWNKSTAGLGDLPVDNIRIACMIYNTAQDVKVDFYHQTIDRNEDQRWVVFPWEA
jgi:hypoxanthine phosphoribosyltransferase